MNLEQVSKAFKGLMAVHTVSMKLEEGQILGLIGPNGAGKTTLFNLITGVYPPTEGKIFFEGKDITSTRPARRCRHGHRTHVPTGAALPGAIGAGQRGHGQGIRARLGEEPVPSREGVDRDP